jgi:phosphoserine phosphatase RsbU/P
MQAIKHTIEKQPDIILMDWQMPVMSGIEALKELKHNENTKNIPVIMLTASEATNEAFEAGASDYILKPFEKTELVARVNTLLELVNTRNELNKRNVEYKIQREKFKLQKDILVIQKKELTEILKISLGLNHSFENLNNILENTISEYFFISNKIENIPSNFFWIKSNENIIIFCAGFFSKNGINASMFSMAIHNFLNEIIIDKGMCLLPSEIIQILKEKLKTFFALENYALKIIDIVFCFIDLNSRTLQYAGINIPVYVMKKDKLVELKTDKSENGFNINFSTSTNHKVYLAEGDIVYLMNDGFKINRTNSNENGYVSEEILEIVRKIHTKDLPKQKELLQKAFESLKHKSSQVNDILVFAKKI